MEVRSSRGIGQEDQPAARRHASHQLDLQSRGVERGLHACGAQLQEGPLGTGNYLIALELTALDEQRAFMHIQYSYTQGFLTRWATSVYFSTRGRDKVGFTWIHDEGEPPRLVRGIRGALERNTMRYYLAVDAYLHALGSPAPQRFEQSLERWFAHTERFARQLREVKHDDDITMKRGQYLRQQAVL